MDELTLKVPELQDELNRLLEKMFLCYFYSSGEKYVVLIYESILDNCRIHRLSLFFDSSWVVESISNDILQIVHRWLDNLNVAKFRQLERNHIIKEELIEKAWHPLRFQSIIDSTL